MQSKNKYQRNRPSRQGLRSRGSSKTTTTDQPFMVNDHIIENVRIEDIRIDYLRGYLEVESNFLYRDSFHQHTHSLQLPHYPLLIELLCSSLSFIFRRSNQCESVETCIFLSMRTRSLRPSVNRMATSTLHKTCFNHLRQRHHIC